MKGAYGFVLAAITLLVLGCGEPGETPALNDNPPAYVENLVAYKAGADGIIIYFVLVDDYGTMTTADGKAIIKITEPYTAADVVADMLQGAFDYAHSDRNARESPSVDMSQVETGVELFSSEYAVSKQGFRKAEIGEGSFKHDKIICVIGRISYDSFKEQPSKLSGEVTLEFQTPDGKVFKGKDTISF